MDTCANATKVGDLAALQILRAINVPWTKETLINAARFGHLECLKYAFENHCPVPTMKEFGVIHSRCIEYVCLVIAPS